MKSKFLTFLTISLPLMTIAMPFGSIYLYEASDPIALLSIADFKSTVLATSNAWLIEFYSSWCGHCIDFAPAFKQLANDVKGWGKVIKIGAVDCALEENLPLCREYEVMAYPSLKFFQSYSEASQLGALRLGSKKVDDIRHSMVDFIEKQFEEKKASAHWPLLSLLGNETLDDLWAHYNNPEIVLLFENGDETDKYWSREVILDASPFSDYPPIRRVNSAHQDLIAKFNIKTLPAFVFMERAGKSVVYEITPSREVLSKMMAKFFSSHEDTQPAKKENHDSKTVIPAPTKKKVIVKKGFDQAFMADLEKGIYYSFSHEVAVHKTIAKVELQALKDFLAVLEAYFPGRRKIKEVLRSLRTKLEPFKKQTKGEEFNKMWQSSIESTYPEWKTEIEDWVGCEGSSPQFRGYPCSLWTLFHTLTVSYALAEPTSPQPARILFAMKGFIKYFFSCSHCSNHFVEMAEDEADPIAAVDSSNAAVMWLWRGHNKVNRRIASDLSEDPQFPKIQFPSIDNCPQCYSHGELDEEKTFDYLIKVYSPVGLKLDGLRADPSNETAKGTGVSIHAFQIGTLSFTKYDISLCAGIYLLSSVILLCVLCRMVFKRRSLRKYVYNIYGKI